MYSLISSFNYFSLTSKKHLFRSKKAAVIVAFVSLYNSLSTYPMYLTSTQHKIPTHFKTLQLRNQLTSYSNALFYKLETKYIMSYNKVSQKRITTPHTTTLKNLLIEYSPFFLTKILFFSWQVFKFNKKRFNRNKLITTPYLNYFNTIKDYKINNQNYFWYKKKKFTWKGKIIKRKLFHNLSRVSKIRRQELTFLQQVNSKPTLYAFKARQATIFKPELNFVTKTNLVLGNINPQLSNINLLLLVIFNPIMFKVFKIWDMNKPKNSIQTLNYRLNKLNLQPYSNITPQQTFNKVLTKQLSSLFSMNKIREDIIPFYYHTLVRFIEHCSGKKFLFQFYPFLHQNINLNYVIRYKSWIPRMGSYERRLGHKFFFEEALHIMHLSFILRDAVLFSNWLKSMILRISFWKTRSIFRFIRYLYLLYFTSTFTELKIKGLKIKLKGKISVAGNSRKRTILYRTGQTSHSKVSLRVSHHKQTINTFTGVLGFQVWIFY